MTEDWDIYFIVAKSVPLIENGDNILVTDENKEEYLKLMVNYKCKITETQSRMDALIKGILSVVPLEFLKIFNPRELGVRTYKHHMTNYVY